MAKSAENSRVDAVSLFPDLFSKKIKQRRSVDKNSVDIELQPFSRSSSRIVRPPLPPDISWLRNGDTEKLEEGPLDIPSALVLIPNEKIREKAISVITNYGYLVESVETPFEAIHRLSFSDYGIVVHHTSFEDRISFTDSVVHNFLCKLPMSRRRGVYYIVIGPHLQTYYRLSALSLSANLVVNDEHIIHLKKILRSGFREYEELFGPIMELLQDRS